MTASVPIPTSEIQALQTLILQAWSSQYGIIIDPTTVTGSFITPRTETRIGYELDTTLNDDYLKIRMYGRLFTLSPQINPFRQEKIENDGNGVGTTVYVSISDLPIQAFPILSQTLNPSIDGAATAYALQLEDLSGYIETEVSTTQVPDYIVTEDSPV